LIGTVFFKSLAGQAQMAFFLLMTLIKNLRRLLKAAGETLNKRVKSLFEISLQYFLIKKMFENKITLNLASQGK
jgi:hypothetical protein